MRISKIQVKNFRILKNSTMDFDNELCLLLGRNNTGKTSFMVLIEKFLKNGDFDFNDFSIDLREKLFSFDGDSDVNELAIQLILSIEYDEVDDLCNLSEFILDLDPECRTINLLFERVIKKEKLLEGLTTMGNMPKDKFIINHIKEYMHTKIYTFGEQSDLLTENRYKMVEKEMKSIERLIDFEIIHAKRNVSSSEEKAGEKVLSKLTTEYFNQAHKNAPDKFESINELMKDMDDTLDGNYQSFFNDFLTNAKNFLDMQNLKVVSNLKAKEIVNDSSEVVYGDPAQRLPEHLNGLGHMNILFLLLSIEIKKASFKANNKDIKLLLIEEPEAHTHPQIQYIFAQKIESILKEVPHMQTIISTHSPYIVSKHPFENIRYMALDKGGGSNNIIIKNFHKELSKKYEEKEEFSFLKQYLSIQSAELFFADKAIFIEGISEGILLDYFIDKFDQKKQEEEKGNNKKYKALSGQNVTVLQVGANAKAFRHFIEFLNIPTLIITDIDTVSGEMGEKGRMIYTACKVAGDVCNTSNQTIQYYYSAPVFQYKSPQSIAWLNSIIDHTCSCLSPLVKVNYQQKEESYYPRSFEDAFINVNLQTLKDNKNDLLGIKNIDAFDNDQDVYELTKNVVEKKSDFASSLLYLAYTNKGIEWITPQYIQEGLEWLQNQEIQQ